MKTNWKVFLSITAFVIIAGLGSVFLISKDKLSDGDIAIENGDGSVAGTSTETDDYVLRLINHLNDVGMVLYGSYLSPETKQQKNLFGNLADKLDYVECDQSGPFSNTDECISNNVSIYPTWVYQGKSYPGIQKLADLAKISNFEQ